MAYIYYKIELYKRKTDGSGGWETTAETISGHFNKRVQRAIGSKKDTFSFNLMNSYNKYFSPTSKFENGDLIKIYAKKNSMTITIDDLLLAGTILNVVSTMGTNNVVRIEGKSRTETFLEGLCFVTSATELTPPEILERSLNFYNSNNTNYPITWKATNPSTKSDGSSFPTYYIADFYKPMNQVFERYSGTDYTKDGNYYYYINDDNELVWTQMANESNADLNEVQCQKVSVNSKQDTIINSIYLKCGSDLYGKGITSYTFDYSSRAKNGAKWKILTSTNNLFNSISTYEIITNSASFDVDGDQFPTSYNYTTTFGETVSSDAEYNTALRLEARRRGKEEGNNYLTQYKEEVLKATATLPFTRDYFYGNVLSCTFPSYNLENKKLRITTIEYKDYSTILHLREDEVTV